MKVDVVAIDVGGTGFIQVAFGLGAGETVKDRAEVSFLLNLAQVESHELVSPVVAHSALNQVISGLCQSL